MTFVVAHARREFALIAADTRTRWYEWEEGRAADAQLTRVTDGQGAKIYPLRGGWLAGAGARRPRERIARAFAAEDPADLTTLARRLDEQRPLVLADYEGRCPTGSGIVYSIYGADGRFYCHRWYTLTGDHDDASSGAGCTANCCCPVPLEPRDLQPLLNGYNRLLGRVRTLPDAIRQTAGFFVAVRDRLGEDGSMSAAIQLGVLRPGAGGAVEQRYLPAQPAAVLERATDVEIEALLAEPFDDGLYSVSANSGDGFQIYSEVKLDPNNGINEGSAVHHLGRHYEEVTVHGPDSDGDVNVSFAQTYQNPPQLTLKGGQFITYDSSIGSGSTQRLQLQALNPTASGFTSRSRIATLGVLTNQTDEFASGAISTVGGTKEATLSPGGATSDQYDVHYQVQISTSSWPVFLTVAIDVWRTDLGQWVETATYNYSTDTNQTWTEEIKNITAAPISKIRLRVKSWTDGLGTGSFAVYGGDAGGSNPGAFDGVTYTTSSDTANSAIPGDSDRVTWVAWEMV